MTLLNSLFVFVMTAYIQQGSILHSMYHLLDEGLGLSGSKVRKTV